MSSVAEKASEKEKKKRQEEEEDHEEEEKHPKKKKKATGSSSNVPTSFELSKKKRVSVSVFKGNILIDIREYYEDREDGALKPGKKGISLHPGRY